MHLVSPSNCFSTPPLKKKVTWAYFSVSAWNKNYHLSAKKMEMMFCTDEVVFLKPYVPAQWNWGTLWIDSHSASTFFGVTGGNKTGKGNSFLYCVIVIWCWKTEHVYFNIRFVTIDTFHKWQAITNSVKLTLVTSCLSWYFKSIFTPKRVK